MNDSDMVVALRKRIFEDWRSKRLTWREVKAKYGFSKKWFYKWLGRYIRLYEVDRVGCVYAAAKASFEKRLYSSISL